MNEVRETITDSSFTIRETCGPDDRNYEKIGRAHV